MITPIISDKRPIINVNINGKEASMLVDNKDGLSFSSSQNAEALIERDCVFEATCFYPPQPPDPGE